MTENPQLDWQSGSLPKLADALISAPVLFEADGRLYAGHYHCNGFFYNDQHCHDREGSLGFAQGDPAACRGYVCYDPAIPVVTRWAYLNAPD